jgi:hypothetical protein
MGKKEKGTFLKVALIWNETILKEEAFLKPKIITVGEDSKTSLFTIHSEDVKLGKNFNLFTPSENKKYQLTLLETMSGDIKVNNEEYNLKDFMKNKCQKSGDKYTFEVSPFDSGNIDIGEQTLSWGFIQEIAVATGGALKFDKTFAFYLFITAILHIVLALYVSAMEIVEDELSFADIPDRFAKIMVEEAEEDKKDDEDKKKKGRKKENIGKRMGGKQGKIGDKKTPKYIKTKIPKARKELITKSLKARGVFGAVSNSGFTDLTDDSGPNVAGRLQASFNGTSGDEFVAGRGSGGTGFRGTGTGGGGTGYGRIGGTGDIDTGGGRGTKVSLSKGRKGERKVPKLKKGTASFSGFCKKSDIQNVVSRKSKSIRYCYEKELQRTRDLKGKVKLVWIIGMNGKVESVNVQEDTVKNPRMTSCLKRQVERWSFNKPEGGKCKIAYPFIFTAD